MEKHIERIEKIIKKRRIISNRNFDITIIYNNVSSFINDNV
tara:strand:- start:174 stop:296 length:123 start_codon:yes stop_codon:yes gene_type:complete